MERYVLEALLRMGYGAHALTRMRRRYAQMIDSEWTTLRAGRGIGAEGFGGGTYNHAWSGGPLTVLSQRVAELETTAPGWGRYRVAPQLSGLAEVEAWAPVPGGELHVRWTQERDETVGRIAAPTGLEGELVVEARAVTIDGQRHAGDEVAGGYRYALPAGGGQVRYPRDTSPKRDSPRHPAAGCRAAPVGTRGRVAPIPSVA